MEIDTRSLSVALDGGHYKKAFAVWSLILQAKIKDPQTSCEGKCCRQISLRVSLNKPAIYKMKEGNRLKEILNDWTDDSVNKVLT